jgi:DNA-binding FadR family transcriptional regulator
VQQLPEGDLDYTERFPGLDHKFHLALAKASQNEVLFELIRKLRKEVAVAIDMIPWMEQNRTLGVSSMALIVRAVKQKSPVDARIGMSLHLTYLPGVVERVFQH